MQIKTFRAKTMQQALHLVRHELGPDAAVLHTRELNSGLVRRMVFGRQYEVAASTAVNVPSRLPARLQEQEARSEEPPKVYPARSGDHAASALYAPGSILLAGQLNQLQEMIEKLCERSSTKPQHNLPEAFFHVYTDIIEADIDEAIARDLVDRVRLDQGAQGMADSLLIKARVAQLLEEEITVTGPITMNSDKCRLVALVGPTGVGKTTTIAKLAANHRLREKKRVGLITVDTYRVAAVEQLRTYADIIDLPMEVVATPREMREAVSRMRHLDLVLMDTAGRSPRDEVKIQELRSLLAEAEPDQVMLVLSATAGARSLTTTAERFAEVGTTALLLTKLDEATSLGHLASLARECRLPVSYLTDGQNVPDDIQVAERRRLAYLMLGIQR
ncbi:MAG TPA: flagellar biosynthesis protein FlhF [Lacipirellulaceae bacterium]|jgi:flagellar biosynthesis protein FlhF